MAELIEIKLQPPMLPAAAHALMSMSLPGTFPTGWSCANEYCLRDLRALPELYHVRVSLRIFHVTQEKVALTCSERCAARFMLSWWVPPDAGLVLY